MIPILDRSRAMDVRDAPARERGGAVRGTGFFPVRNPDVPDGLRAAVFRRADAVFALPEEDRRVASILDTPQFRGFRREATCAPQAAP